MRISWSLLLILVAGCAAPRHAVIDDVSLPDMLDTEYRVVGVDDAPVKRAKSSVHTVAPLVLVPPGTHTFALESPHDPEAKTLEATVEEGKEYRIALDEEGKASLVEHNVAAVRGR